MSIAPPSTSACRTRHRQEIRGGLGFRLEFDRQVFGIAGTWKRLAAGLALGLGLLPTAQSADAPASAPTLSRAEINFADLALQRSLLRMSLPTLAVPPLQVLSAPLPVPSSVPVVAQSARGAQFSSISAQSIGPRSPAPATNFLALLDNDTSIPPDTHGAVGLNHIVVTLNSEVRIQGKGGAVLSTLPLATFWQSVAGGSTDVFDPKVLYDPFDNRFMVTACLNAFSPFSSVLIGVSQSSDPTAGWTLYRVDADSTDQTWADYPGFGFNRRWIVVTMNMFDIGGAGNFNRTHVYAFDKTNLYAGGLGASNSLRQDFSTFTLQPAATHDNTIDTLYLVSNLRGDDGLGNGSLILYSLTGAIGAESLNPIALISTPNPWSDSPFAGNSDFAPQLGSPTRIMNNDSRLLNAVYRNGTIWCAHTVFLPAGTGTRSAAQWWQINPSGVVVQRGRVDDPSGQRFFAFPAIGVNRNNDALLGYSSFSATQYASASYSFRFAGDAPNTMQSEVIYKAGEAPYYKVFSGTRNRWGDYSATAVDPVNDLDLWTIQEYAATPVGGVDRWGTWWAKVSLSTPPDGILEVTVSPPGGSVLRAGTSRPFFVSVFDSLPITNAGVFATVPGAFTNLPALNSGLPPDAFANDNIYTTTIDAPPTNTTLTLILSISAPGATGLFLTNTYLVLTPPTNDNFLAAVKIPDNGGVVLGNNTFASTETGEPLHAGVPSVANSVWFNWAPTNTGTVLLDPLGSSFNTVLAVYSGNSLASLVPLAAVDDIRDPSGALIQSQGYLFFTATAGQTYRIAVAGFDTNSFGGIRLRMEFGGLPDTSAPVVTVTNILSGSVSITNPPSGFITTNGTLIISGTAVDPQPNGSGVVSVTVTGNDRIPMVATGTNTWTVTRNLQAGTNAFQFTAVDAADNRSLPVNFSVIYRVFDPFNDVFENALPLPGSSGAVSTNNFNATFEPGEPLHAGKLGGKSAWWVFTPASDGVLSLTTLGSTMDTLMGLYTGTRVDQLTVISSNDDAAGVGTHSAITNAVRAGVPHYVAVDGLAGVTGQIVLSYAFTAVAIFDLTVTNTAGGGVSPGSSSFPSNSLVTLLATPATGFGFVTWQGGAVTLDNPLTLTLRSNTTVTGVFAQREITDNFESGAFRTNIAWTTTGSPAWSVQLTNSTATNAPLGGRYFARSGTIGNNQTNALRLVVNLRAGTGSFAYRVSAEAFGPDAGDFFEFYLNGTRRLRLNGESGWLLHAFPVSAGTNTLEWRYLKDPSLALNLDAAFIDNVDLPLVEPVNTTTPAIFGTNTVRLANGSFQFQVAGQTNQIYVIQGSTDLFNWVSLSTNQAPFGLIQFTDLQSTNFPLRYYRAIVP